MMILECIGLEAGNPCWPEEPGGQAIDGWEETDKAKLACFLNSALSVWECLETNRFRFWC